MEFLDLLKNIEREVQPHFGKGKVASYIPALRRVPPTKFGMAVRFLDGRQCAVGDADDPFSIQSISKLFTLMLAMNTVGDEIWRRVAATGVQHLCAFNYRFVPAVRLARELIDAGRLGDIRHFRGRYLQDWGDTDAQVWRFDAAAAGSGALGDLAAHVVDLARYLVGEIDEVGGFAHTFIPGREVDDAVESTLRFANGAVGTLEATRLALGRRNAFQWEVNGTKGSLAFDMERLNELQVFDEDGDRARGFKTVLVSETSHPFWEHWWPPGHIVGWGDTFVHELHHFLAAIAADTDVAPHGATFEDGYRAAEVCDAIVRSSESGRREAISYRSIPA